MKNRKKQLWDIMKSHPKRFGILVPLLALFLFSSSLLLIFHQHAIAQISSLSAPSISQKYSDPTSRFSISYPSDWKEGRTSEISPIVKIAFAAPPDYKKATVLVRVIPLANASLSVNDILKVVINNLPPDSQNISTKPTTLSNHEARLLTYMINGNGQRPNMGVADAMTKDNRGILYVVSYNADTSVYSKALPVVTNMFNSFQFITGLSRQINNEGSSLPQPTSGGPFAGNTSQPAGIVNLPGSSVDLGTLDTPFKQIQSRHMPFH